MRKNFSRDNRPGKPADHAHRFDYKIIEPLIQLRKDGVRKVGAALGLPASLFDRIPFPGPALAARVLGEVTPDRVKIVRKATSIVEKELSEMKVFQYLKQPKIGLLNQNIG